jgi:hypothetical protein
MDGQCEAAVLGQLRRAVPQLRSINCTASSRPSWSSRPSGEVRRHGNLSLIGPSSRCQGSERPDAPDLDNYGCLPLGCQDRAVQLASSGFARSVRRLLLAVALPAIPVGPVSYALTKMAECPDRCEPKPPPAVARHSAIGTARASIPVASRSGGADAFLWLCNPREALDMQSVPHPHHIVGHLSGRGRACSQQAQGEHTLLVPTSPTEGIRWLIC